ncbi:manganese efflux pump MntP family protein [Bacillus piscicola]|uniref:manganese efflux pump MntP n=1 Tax=Bacillus piscicola TaxID=1632684 RepID=UPI001F09967E|nr:manganese efflux pump [Bacillus piscicola]
MSGWIILFTMGFALSMDAFSMSLAVAMQNNQHVNKLRVAVVVGLFHMVMPYIGLTSGRWIASTFEQIALIAAGALLAIIGLQMIKAGWSSDENVQSVIVPHGFGLFAFALLVSLDSFSIGISLGILNAPLLSVLLVFGLFSAFFTWGGLTLGGHLQYTFGRYGEIIGGVILCGFGLKLIF